VVPGPLRRSRVRPVLDVLSQLVERCRGGSCDGERGRRRVPVYRGCDECRVARWATLGVRGVQTRVAVTVPGMGRRSFDPWEEIHDHGDADLALAFARLFWPTFVERQGCVVIEHRAEGAAIAEAFDRSGGDPRAVEERLNRVALREQMPIEDSEIEDETFLEVAQIMQRSWRAALAEQFPGREFVVELLDSEDDWNGATLYLVSGPRRDSRA
jgi:hypothetical protein